MTHPLHRTYFAKGHGTENDFVLVPDPEGKLQFGSTAAVQVCNRRSGIGGDGLMRAVRSDALPAGQGMDAEWFMDHRNADGTTAPMCGNGLRVFAAYLEQRGWINLDQGAVNIGTRSGVKQVRREGPLLVTNIGPWRFDGAEAGGSPRHDAFVLLNAETEPIPGLKVDVGTFHVAIRLPDLQRLRAADLTVAPTVKPAPLQGINVELVVVLSGPEDPIGHVAMRIHERGAGETHSCGTGAVAAVVAARAWADGSAHDRWDVDVPGGTLQVSVPAGDALAGDTVEVAGPAAIVAEGELDSRLSQLLTPA